MPDLIAQGPEEGQRWRRGISGERPVSLGRAAADWTAAWDEQISRQHAMLHWRAGRLHVTRVATARNPLFFQGQAVERCELRVGEHFVIGNTTFTLADEPVLVTLETPQPASQQTFQRNELSRADFRDADERIAALSRLPEIIAGAADDNELSVRLVNLLLAGVPRASAVALVACAERTEKNQDTPSIQVLHWDRRGVTGGAFSPSERLIRQALQRHETVLHAWHGTGAVDGGAFTISSDADWAFCTPVRGAACHGWALYVAGRSDVATKPASDVLAAGPDVRDDVKFTELVATTFSHLRETRLLTRQQASLSQFFSPVVLQALAGRDPDEVLAPRETEVSVLFCDLRGFSRAAERYAADLHGLLRRVSQALGVMTRHILDTGGVVGDFHGDAAMGFWGWPLSQEDAVQRACRAALAIRAEFTAAARQADHPLSDFRIGIGIATGRAVAGKIGTIDQVKVTVFGPVVNLASRLEEMTKLLRAPILMDASTAETARNQISPATARVRRVAVVRPYGLEASVEVHELLPSVADYPNLSNEHLAAYEEAVTALLARDWPRAFQLLHLVPAEDRVKDFLTVFIAQHNRTPPEHWDGVIPLSSK